MPVPGNWTLFFDWGSSGQYSSTPMTVASNNTFSLGEGSAGVWVQVAGMFTFQFNGFKTTYSGNLADKSITGINTTFDGLDGSFFMLEEGAEVASRAKTGRHSVADASGKRGPNAP
jgi:hypothetical protein